MNHEDLKMDHEMLVKEIKLIRRRLREITGSDSDYTKELLDEVAKLLGIKDRMNARTAHVTEVLSENVRLKSQLENERLLNKSLNDRL